jgi:hypothetical protein
MVGARELLVEVQCALLSLYLTYTLVGKELQENEDVDV